MDERLVLVEEREMERTELKPNRGERLDMKMMVMMIITEKVMVMVAKDMVVIIDCESFIARQTEGSPLVRLKRNYAVT